MEVLSVQGIPFRLIPALQPIIHIPSISSPINNCPNSKGPNRHTAAGYNLFEGLKQAIADLGYTPARVCEVSRRAI